MDRIQLLNAIITKKKAKNYLEIGVLYGKCFLNIKAQRKFAVDPDYKIGWEHRKDTLMKKINRRFFSTFELYYKKESDTFFKEDGAFLSKYPLDVAFIDGLHNYDQSLRDVENCLRYMADDAVIAMHDCKPENAAMAYPALSPAEVAKLNLPEWDNIWMGDVWKTILHLRKNRSDLIAFVIDTDCGLGVVMKKTPKNEHLSRPLVATVGDIEQLTYSDLKENLNDYLDLKPVSFAQDFLNTL